jgi:hypothetical protein
MAENVKVAVVDTVVVIAADVGGFVVVFLDAPIAESATCEPALVVFLASVDSALVALLAALTTVGAACDPAWVAFVDSEPGEPYWAWLVDKARAKRSTSEVARRGMITCEWMERVRVCLVVRKVEKR